MSSGFRGFSFKLNKKNDKSTLGKSKLPCDAAEPEEATEFVNALEDKQIKSSIVPKLKEELVIPLIKRNVWRLPKSDVLESIPDKLDRQAIAEIMQEGNSVVEGVTSEEKTIPLSMLNQIPQGFETDERMDVSLRPNPSTQDDYEKVPVDQFGLAMLRGMGWKPGTAIGLRNKDCVEAVEVVVRPKGLGLGADRSSLKRPSKEPQREEEETLVLISSLVCVESGFNKGRYGQVESLDEETGRAVVRLALSGESVSVPELSLRVVSKKEFQKEAHVLNKNKFEEHRLRDDEVVEPDRDGWLRPRLLVRFVDEEFKGGKYYNTKLIVERVLCPLTCTCRTADSSKQLLEGIRTEMLETVVPKDKDRPVMILRGRRASQMGRVVERDKRKCLATVRLLSGKLVHNLSYDDVCEFVDQ